MEAEAGADLPFSGLRVRYRRSGDVEIPGLSGTALNTIRYSEEGAIQR